MYTETLIRFALHFVVLLLLAPILQGVIIRVKSLFAGRRGAPILQPWFDIIRLLRKDYVFSRTTSWIFLLGPVVALVVPLMAATLIPFGALPSPVSFEGDMILFVYLFALSRFLLQPPHSTPVPVLRGWALPGKSPSPVWPNRPCCSP
jgi:formate hydrogenlyase subunit 4